MPDTWPPAPPLVVPREALPSQPERDRVKVLHVITRLVGGSAGNTITSALGMDGDRYDCWVASAPGGAYWDDAERGGLRTVQLPRMREEIAPLDDAATLWHLVTLMRRERFDLVHTHCAKAGLLGRVAARLAGVPAVVHTFHALTAHDYMSARLRACYVMLDRLARPLADQYVSVAPRLAHQVVRSRIVRPGNITVVPSGVDIEALPVGAPPSVRRELGIPADAPLVGTVGRIVAQKAPLNFVRMAAAVKRSRPDAVFIMVGDASLEGRPLEQATRDEARRLGVDVVFTGYRADAAQIAALFDVYVVPSLYEGLGRALTEAMASARPVVATAVNGVPDLVEPGSTGLLARPGDPEDLADKVLWLLEHPAEGRLMGAQGRARVLSTFDVGTMCSALDGIYSRLIGLGAVSAASSARADSTPGVPRRLPLPTQSALPTQKIDGRVH
jgi:glycosyltransferase involved in cell wall biosynthesis